MKRNFFERTKKLGNCHTVQIIKRDYFSVWNVTIQDNNGRAVYAVEFDNNVSICDVYKNISLYATVTGIRNR